MLTSAFQSLSWTPSSEFGQSMDVLEQFVCHVYGQKHITMVDEARFVIFASLQSGNLREIPPSKGALKQHVLRSAYQAGWIWGNTLSANTTPDIDHWGWSIDNEQQKLLYKWTNLGADRELANIISTCKCRSDSSICNKCSCGKKNVNCLSFCSCKKKCLVNRVNKL